MGRSVAITVAAMRGGFVSSTLVRAHLANAASPGEAHAVRL